MIRCHCVGVCYVNFQEQPKKVAVIGAGYIAVELAGVFQSLGTDTTLLVRGDRPLRSFDSLLVDTLVSEMGKSGLALRPHSTTKVGSIAACILLVGVQFPRVAFVNSGLSLLLVIFSARRIFRVFLAF